MKIWLPALVLACCLAFSLAGFRWGLSTHPCRRCNYYGNRGQFCLRTLNRYAYRNEFICKYPRIPFDPCSRCGSGKYCYQYSQGYFKCQAIFHSRPYYPRPQPNYQHRSPYYQHRSPYYLHPQPYNYRPQPVYRPNPVYKPQQFVYKVVQPAVRRPQPVVFKPVPFAQRPVAPNPAVPKPVIRRPINPVVNKPLAGQNVIYGK